MKTVVAFVGGAQHGKDTAAEMIRSLSNKVYPWKLGFADLLKKHAQIMGWDGEKDIPGRDFLIELTPPVKKYGNWLAEKYPHKYGEYANNNYYSANLYKTILQDDHEIFCISDMRFQCEYDYFKSKEDKGEIHFYVVQVLRTDSNGKYYIGSLTKEQLNSASENEWKQFPVHSVILNNSDLDDFKKDVKDLFSRILSLTERN